MKRSLLLFGVLVAFGACPARVQTRPNDELPAKMTPADVNAQNARASGQPPPLPGTQPPMSADPK